MKVKFTIQKGKEKLKTGMLSSKEIDNYELNATFTPSEKEKKIFNDHPLFKEMIFMEYNEIDKFHASILGSITGIGKQETVDRTKQISVGSIYSSPTYAFRAHSVARIVELRGLVIEAGESFANIVKVLEGLEGTDEIEFKPTE